MIDPKGIYRGRYKKFIESLEPLPLTEFGEDHHIIPKCTFKGTHISNEIFNNKLNLLRMTPANHYRAHLILAEENPDDRDLCCAILRMRTTGNHEQREDITPEDYEKAKLLFSKAQSEYMKRCNVWRGKKSAKQLEFSKRPKSEGTKSKIGKSVSDLWKDPKYRENQSLKQSRREIKCVCVVCGEEFYGGCSRAKYCTNQCRDLADWLLGKPSFLENFFGPCGNKFYKI